MYGEYEEVDEQDNNNLGDDFLGEDGPTLADHGVMGDDDDDEPQGVDELEYEHQDHIGLSPPHPLDADYVQGESDSGVDSADQDDDEGDDFSDKDGSGGPFDMITMIMVRSCSG